MFCPECRLEYRPGFTHCPDCDVDLVGALPQSSAAAQAGMRDLRSPTVLRRGVSSMDAGVIRAVLNEAGIVFNERRAAAEIVADGSPACEFWVNLEDRPNADAALAKALHEDDDTIGLEFLWGGSDRAFFNHLCAALDEKRIDCFKHDSLASQQAASFSQYPLEVSVSVGDFEAASAVYEAAREKWNPGAPPLDASGPLNLPADSAPDEDIDDVPLDDQDFDDALTAEAWSGAAAQQAELLKLCLREVGVASRVATNGPRVRLMVEPKFIDRAREVVREVIESTPSE